MSPLRSLLIPWLLPLAVLAAQEPKLPPRPTDVGAALRNKPVTPPVPDGARVELVDAKTDQPIADADVFVVDQSLLQPLRRQLREVQQSFAADQDAYHELLAAWFGTRYRAGADGTVTVARVEPASILALAKDHFAVQRVRSWPEDSLSIRLAERRFVEVLVTDSKGKPAAEVPVAFGSLWEHGEEHQFFVGLVEALTDGSGRARVQVQRLRGEGKLAVQALVVLEKPLRQKFQLDERDQPSEALALQLPPCGMARVLLYDEQEHPLQGLQDVTLKLGDAAHGRDSHGKPSRLAPDGALFRWVGLNLQLQVEARMKGLDGVLRHEQPGPTRVGELVVCGVRMTAADPIVRLRPLDAQGKPQPNTVFGLVRATEKSFEGRELTSDGDGRLQFSVDSQWLQQGGEPLVLLLARGEGTEVTHYQGALRVPVDAETRGIVDLGDVAFAEEPLLASGVVVDQDGKPLAGVVLQATLSWLHASQSSSRQGGGRKLFFEHRVRTDEQGRFAIRELSPKDVALRLKIAGGKWVLEDSAAAMPGGRALRLVAVLAGNVSCTLAKESHTGSVGLQLRRQQEGAESQHSWSKDGRFEWNGLLPGRYSLQIATVGDDVELLRDLEVKAGETCADPRLQDLDPRQHVTFVQVRLRRPDGKPAEGVQVHAVHQRGGGGGSATATNTDAAGQAAFTLPKLGGTITVAHADYRTVAIESPPADCGIDLVPRARVKLLLPADLKLPDGVVVVVQPTDTPWWHDRELRGEVTWANGKDVVVRPDRDGPLRVELFDKDRQSLWVGKVDVPAGDQVDVTLPLDAAAVAALREAFGDGKE